MIELDKTIDAVEDAHARGELRACMGLLQQYVSARERQHEEIEKAIYRPGEGTLKTQDDFSKEASAAAGRFPVPPWEPITQCAETRLPKLGR